MNGLKTVPELKITYIHIYVVRLILHQYLRSNKFAFISLQRYSEEKSTNKGKQKCQQRTIQ